MENKVICDGLFVLCDEIVQYYLGATRSDSLELASMKYLFEDDAHGLH
jgi:hypothetical protein